MQPNRIPLIAHQHWKLWFTFALLTLSGALIWLDQQFANLLSVARHVPTFIGTLLGFAAMIFAVLAIRCPACRTSLAWRAISENTPYTWLPWLLKETKCPKCGYSADAKNDADQKA